MRKYRHIVWILLCLASVGLNSTVAFAQNPQTPEQIIEEPADGPVPVSPGGIPQPLVPPPNMVEYPPPGYGPPGGYPGSVPNPWPETSPYDHSFDQTRNYKGLWFNQNNNMGRRYEASLEYLRVGLYGPGPTLVGNAKHFYTATSNAPNGSTGFSDYNTSVLANQFTTGFNGFGSDGLRGRWAVINADDSRLDTDLWWVGQTDNEWRPQVLPISPTPDTPVEQRLFPRGAVVYDNGSVAGTRALFDLEYRLGYKAGAWGSNIDWAPNAFFDRGWIKVRSLYGLTFLKIQEEFDFQGVQSGLSYTVDPTTGTISGVVVPTDFNPVVTDIYSRANSYLAGPEMGIRYDMGGSKFKIWGVTKVAIAANAEHIQIGGNNAYDIYSGYVPPTPTSTNPTPNAFVTQQSHVHVSPIFQQQIFAESHIFQFVPYLNKTSLFKDANFRFGYNFLLVGEVIRPASAIGWRQPTPIIDYHRSRWEQGAYSFGVDWKY